MLLVSTMLCMSGSAWGDVVNATLDHTASSSRNGSNVITTTVDAELEHYNNTKAAAWGGWAYAQFSFIIPAGHSIESATLTWSTTISGNVGTRNNDVYYVNAGTTINYAGLTSSTHLNPDATFIVNVTKNGPATHTGIQTDVSTAIRTISATQNYIIFKWTNNAAGADLHGKASVNAPTLVITTTAATLYTASFTANNGTITPTITVYTDSERTLPIAKDALSANTTYYYTATLAGYHEYQGSFVVGTSNPTVEFTMTAKETYSYTVKAIDGSSKVLNENLASGSVSEGDAVNVTYPRWILSGTTLYACGSGSVAYNTSFTPNANNYIKNITYNSGTVNNVVFYTEAEDVAGVSVGTNDQRASKNQMGHTGGAENYKQATTLSPGKYIIYMRGQNGNSTARAYNFKVGDGDNVVFTGSIANGTNVDANSDEFSVYETSALSFASDGSSASGVDYFYVVKTGDAVVTPTISAVGWATYCSEYALDFTGVTALTAYTASVDGTTVTFNKVTGKVPANTGLLVSGETTNVPVCASADPVANIMVGVTEETEKAAGTIFVLKNGTNGLGFYKNAKDFTLRANSAYIPAASIPSGATARGFISLDDSATSIKNLTPTLSEGEGAIYTLDGRKANKADLKKGVYLFNGRKVVIK